MSKNFSDKNRTSGEDRQRDMSQTQRDSGKKESERQHKNEMARLQKGLKFVSDEDIVKRRTA
ncbi:MAG: hypothetical protein DMG14_03795 [Acidobacteria bacterium]|nr:MAG: hypothetical protein DMG14_03795 [Acidobacteriota bacterium]